MFLGTSAHVLLAKVQSCKNILHGIGLLGPPNLKWNIFQNKMNVGVRAGLMQGYGGDLGAKAEHTDRHGEVDKKTDRQRDWQIIIL